MPTRMSYDWVPYLGAVVPNTVPNHLAMCALWLHGPRPESQGFRFVELGCGDGANLLPLAFYHPKATFLGIDFSELALARVEEEIKCLGLENIQLRLQDVRDLEVTGFPPCDYIIAHGLYSWVPEDARDAILKFCCSCLKPSGLAYISFNTQPGWATRGVVREILLRSRVVQEAAVLDKAKRAVEVATQLLEDLPSRDYEFGTLLAKELEQVRDGKPGYVFHEYLAEVNDGFWLRDFVARARQRGLDYVADAQDCRWEGLVPQALRSNLAKRDLDPLEQEEMADLLCRRYFRASILCRAEAPRQFMTHREILQKASIATSLRAESDPFDLTEGVVERFFRSQGPEITLDASITKAAVIILAVQWPLGMGLETLFQQASQFMISHGCVVSSCARDQLVEDLIVLVEVGELDLRMEEPSYRTNIREYPRAHALARYEAEHREALTTPYHLPFPFERQALKLVRELDGSRSHAQLQLEFGEDLVDQTLPVLGRWGLLSEHVDKKDE